MEEVGNEEFLGTLQSFQKDKILGPDDLYLELFLGCFDFIGDYLRRMTPKLLF
jgi:hypothetical protein